MTEEPRNRVDFERLREANDRTREKKRSDPHALLRAVVQLEENLHCSARVGNVNLESDEPVDRGGDGLAPTPLQYFIASAGF